MFGSIFKTITKWEVVFIILAILTITLTFSIYKTYKTVEGFYPLTEERIAYADKSKRRFNAYADIQDQAGVTIIPGGKQGDPILNNLLNTPSYEGSSSKGVLAGLENVNELNFRVPPEQSELVSRIRLCQSVTTWDCNSFRDPNFDRYCGICSADGEDHAGGPHIGGLYLDPRTKQIEIEMAAKENRKPKFEPTIGKCKGKFLALRPNCDIEKDRDDCSKYTNLDTQDAKDKCGLCILNNNMVYIGNRKDKEGDYALVKKPLKFKSVLKFAVSDPNTAKVVIYQQKPENIGSSTVEWFQVEGGAFTPNTAIYYIVIEGQENQQVRINIQYPEYKDYKLSVEDEKRVTSLTSPKRLPLVRAMYGPDQDSYTSDDPRAKDVTAYLQSNFKMLDCSKTSVAISNDGMGGDPNPGIYKQLRLVYGDNGTDFAYAYGKEGRTSQAVKTDNFDELCPVGLNPTEAKKQVCETDTNGKTIEGRIFTGGNNIAYSGASRDSICVDRLNNVRRGIVGLWESMGRVPRSVPLDISVTHLNGYAISNIGPDKIGTLGGSKAFKNKVSTSNAPGIPGNLFWFWAKDNYLAKVDITTVIPATLADPTVPEDINLCPTGPIASTQEAIIRLEAGVCDKPLNGQPQGPGNYSDECIRNLYLSAGCKKEGKAFPSDANKKKAFTTNPLTGDNYTMDEVQNNLDDLYSIANTGKNINGDIFEQTTIEEYSIDCLGIVMTDPCDTAFASSGPHTPQCLDYLFKNAGAGNKKVGMTYAGMTNRSSGNNDSKKSPVMYCQRAGSMSPIDAGGKYNNDAIQIANSQGGISAVKEFYRKIHYDANFNSNVKSQKTALQQCYGIGNTPKPVVCPIKPCSNILLPQNVSLMIGNKIGSITHNGDYDLSFKINVKGIVTTNWGSIIHFTKSGRDCCGFGDRGPAIWFYPNSLKLYIILGDSSQGGDWGIRDTEIVLPNNKESSFMLSCKGPNITITTNGQIYKTTQPATRPGGTFDVWAADPWYAAANADLKDLCFIPG